MNDQNGPTPRRSRRLRAVILLLVVGLVLLELASRAIFRLQKPQAGDDFFRLYRPHPYRVYMLIPGARDAASRVAINSHGFRGPEIELRKPADTVRIACLGDSTTFGDSATTNGHTYPAHLERFLRQPARGSAGNSPRVEAINAGVAGYTSLEALIYFETKLLDYQLDATVLRVGLNDAYFLACFPNFASDYVHARKVFELSRPRLWERSALLSLLLPRGRSIGSPYRRSPSATIEQLTLTDPARLRVNESEQRRCFRPERIAIFARNVRNFIYVARGHNVAPVLSTVVYGPSAGFIGEVIGQINDRLRETAKTLSVPCVDLAREMPWSAEAFVDNFHARDCPEGLEREAKIIADFLVQQKILDQALAKTEARNRKP